MRFKAMVRVLKSLRNEMLETKVAAAEPSIGFLIECLVWNVPNNLFGNPRYEDDLKAILTFLYNATASDRSFGTSRPSTTSAWATTPVTRRSSSLV